MQAQVYSADRSGLHVQVRALVYLHRKWPQRQVDLSSKSKQELRSTHLVDLDLEVRRMLVALSKHWISPPLGKWDKAVLGNHVGDR